MTWMRLVRTEWRNRFVANQESKRRKSAFTPLASAEFVEAAVQWGQRPPEWLILLFLLSAITGIGRHFEKGTAAAPETPAAEEK